MSIAKELKKQHKQIEVQIKKLTKTRLNDRTSESWKNLKELKKLKLQIKDKISRLLRYEVKSGLRSMCDTFSCQATRANCNF